MTDSVLWGVVRPWVAWPLRSPARFAACVTGLLVGVWLLGAVVGPQGPAVPKDNHIGAAAVATTVARPDAQPVAIVKPDDVANAPGPVATAFVRTWGTSSSTLGSVWLDAIAKFGTPEFTRAIQQIDPSTLAFKEVRGEPAVTQSDSTATAVVDTDTGPVKVGLTLGADALWRVHSLQRG